jgi:hypothetical protein
MQLDVLVVSLVGIFNGAINAVAPQLLVLPRPRRPSEHDERSGEPT